LSRKNGNRQLSFLLLGVALLLVLAGCGPSGTASQASPQGDLEGTITISGAWALYPMMIRWQEEFQKLHPNVRLDISAGGAGKGMADALAGAVDIGMVSRAIYPEEEQKGAFWVSVTKDAVFAAISANNPVLEDLLQQGMSRDDFYGVYISGDITNWGQVVGRPEVTDPIHAYTRSDACGAAATWAEYLGGVQEDLLGVAVYGDPGLLDVVIKDPLGLGYNNLNYAFDMETGEPVAGSQVVPIDVNGNGKADPEETYRSKREAVDAVASGRYPSPPARDLNIVTKGKPTGLVQTFIRWILTEGQKYVDETGYVALPQQQIDAQLAKLE
jgi:phosphate transport system substrate-binding protein